MAKYSGRTLDKMTSTQRAARVKQLLASGNSAAIKNPAYLPAKQRQERALNTRLKQPIVEGSTVTNRDLAHQRQAAITTEFGANAVPKQEQQGRDVSGWYDQYLAQLNAYQQGVQKAHEQTAQSLQGLATINQGPTEQAPQGPGSNASVAGLGQQAQLSRSNQFANLQGVSQMQGNNANDYAQALAHVVGPGQKLSAQAGEQQKLQDLKAKIGAASTSFDATAKSNESKNVQAGISNEIAAQTLGVKIGSQKNTATNQAANRRLQNKKWAQATDTTYGLSNGAVSSLRKQGAAGRAKLEAAKTARDKLLHPGAKAKGSKPASGPGSVTGTAEAKQLSLVRKVSQALQNGTYAVKTSDQYGQTVVKQIKGAAAIKKQLQLENVDPAIIDAAVSVYRNKGSIGPNGVKALHKLGVHAGGNFKVVTK